jgi:hypothetical protein
VVDDSAISQCCLGQQYQPTVSGTGQYLAKFIAKHVPHSTGSTNDSSNAIAKKQEHNSICICSSLTLTSQPTARAQQESHLLIHTTNLDNKTGRVGQ